MKKGLLSILAGALVLVGCQNYDDQFDSLESQINALASTVAGLSQVQSDLASLAGTVNSLASTVAGLGSQIDTAVADGLSDIQSDIAAIEAAVEGVASSDEVSAISDAVTAAQEDLDDLLANSSVFTGNVVINNASTLDAFHSMGSTLAIVNGNVDIDVTEAMDITKVQAVVNEILTTTGSFAYDAATKNVAGVTFNNLSGTQTLTLKQADGYEVKSLVSAGVITLDDEWESSVDIIDLRELTTLTSLSDGTAGQLDFPYATEMHLTKIAYYPGGDLTLKTKKGGVLDITALTDTNSSDIVSPFTLTIDGPASMTISGIAGDAAGSSKGAISLTEVATVNVSNFGGTITLGDGVVTATLEDVATSPVITGATDLVTFSIEGVTDYGKTYGTSGATAQAATLLTSAFIDVAISSVHNDLETLTVTGKVDDLDIDAAPALGSITVNASVNTLDVENNGDLTEITLTGSTINDLDLVNNDDLLEATLDYGKYTTVVASGATADAKGDLNVNGNAKLATLTVNTASLNDIDIHTNAKLATISFPNLAAAGTGTNADIDIYGNAFVATSVTDNYDATAAGVAIVTGTTDGATNTGSYTSTAGFSSLKTWLDAAITAGSTATMQVWFDTVEEVKTADVNGTITTTTPGAITQTAANAGSVGAAVYVRPVVAEVSTMDNSVGNEARTYVFDLKRDGLGNVIGLADGEGVKLTYATGQTVTFARSGTDRTTVSSLVDYMDTYDLSAANLDIEAALDSAERYIYTVTYNSISNSVTSAATVSATGFINATFGLDLAGDSRVLSWTATAGDAAEQIADDLVTAIDALADYNATSITTGINAYKSFYVTRDVSGTDTVDRSPLMAAAPALNFVIDAAMTSTTAVLGKAGVGGYETASHLSNTYASSRFSLPSITPTKQSNLRITLKGTNGLAMNSAVTLTFAGNTSNTAISSTITGAQGANELSHLLLVDGVSIVSASANGSSGTADATATTYYVAASNAISAGTENIQTAGVTAITTDRTGWL